MVTELKSMVAVAVEADSGAGKPVAQRYGVRGLPTLLVLRADGTEVARLSGYVEPARFREWLAEARAK